MPIATSTSINLCVADFVYNNFKIAITRCSKSEAIKGVFQKHLISDHRFLIITVKQLAQGYHVNVKNLFFFFPSNAKNLTCNDLQHDSCAARGAKTGSDTRS